MAAPLIGKGPDLRGFNRDTWGDAVADLHKDRKKLTNKEYRKERKKFKKAVSTEIDRLTDRSGLIAVQEENLPSRLQGARDHRSYFR